MLLRSPRLPLLASLPSLLLFALLAVVACNTNGRTTGDDDDSGSGDDDTAGDDDTTGDDDSAGDDDDSAVSGCGFSDLVLSAALSVNATVTTTPYTATTTDYLVVNAALTNTCDDLVGFTTSNSCLVTYTLYDSSSVAVESSLCAELLTAWTLAAGADQPAYITLGALGAGTWTVELTFNSLDGYTDSETMSIVVTN